MLECYGDGEAGLSGPLVLKVASEKKLLVARRRALGALPAGFSAFALLDGPGLTQFRV